MDCIFCKIVNGEQEANIVYQDDTYLVFHDIRPEASLHLLLIPKQHIVQPPVAVEESERAVLGGLFELGLKIAKEEGVAKKGYRLKNNNGDWAGQIVEHFHLHLLADNS